ncbi:MAG: STAS domain-containing protein [Planctomycetota bacterium]|jgi:anti-anti-sigma factor
MTETSPMTGVTRTDGAHIIKFSHIDELDPSCLREVRVYISDLLKTQEPIKIVLDMEEVELLSSEAIGLIVVMGNAIRPRGGELHVANISQRTYSVFEVTQLQNLIRVFESTQEAVDAFD